MICYICSPYRGETSEQIDRHIKYAVHLTRETLLQGNYPVTPHLYITMALDDKNEEERKIGMGAALALMKSCDVLIVGQQYGISKGMDKEIKIAKILNKPIYYFEEKRFFKRR